VAAVTFLVALTTAGAVGIPGALILPLGREFGWDTAEISSALALRLLLFGLMAPFAAALIERYGMRRMVVTADELSGSDAIASDAFKAVITGEPVSGPAAFQCPCARRAAGSGATIRIEKGPKGCRPEVHPLAGDPDNHLV
jgi:hypothetical protein